MVEMGGKLSYLYNTTEVEKLANYFLLYFSTVLRYSWCVGRINQTPRALTTERTRDDGDNRIATFNRNSAKNFRQHESELGWRTQAHLVKGGKGQDCSLTKCPVGKAKGGREDGRCGLLGGGMSGNLSLRVPMRGSGYLYLWVLFSMCSD